jgi:hypothetical protein
MTEDQQIDIGITISCPQRIGTEADDTHDLTHGGEGIEEWLGEVANVRNGLFYDGVVYCIAHTRLFSIVLLNSQPNAGGEPRPKAGAQRKLEGVGSSAGFK